MKPYRLKACFLMALVCALGVTAVAASQPAKPQPAKSQPAAPDQAQIVEQARRAYYNLRAAGLDEFRATIRPNWSMVLKDQLKASPEKAKRR